MQIKRHVAIFDSIFFKLTMLIIFVIALTGGVIGGTSYYLTKKELVEAGKSDMKHIVNTSIVTLNVLNERVEKGELTLEQAQEEARVLLNGPKLAEGYDYKKSAFLYKQDGYLVAYNSSYASILHPKNPIGHMPDDTTNRANMVKAARATNDADRYHPFDDTDDNGNHVTKTAYMAYFEPWDWHVGMIVLDTTFYGELNKVKWTIILMTLGILVISFMIFYFVSRKSLKLLETISAAFLAIANRNIQSTTLPESKDEIGHLGASFNQMLLQLRDLISQLQGTSGQVAETSMSLSAISEETASSSEEIGRAMNDIAQGTVNQAADLEEANQQITRLNTSIEAMNQQSQLIKDITSQSEAATHQGQEMIQRLKQSNEASLASSNEVHTTIESLNSKITGISRMTAVIESISSETNLLALNASIEAARAGEHGKGFAVVASEVQKLAEQSNEATKQIQNMIAAIEGETAKTVQAVSTTIERSKQLDHAVNETETEFTNIAKAITETTNAVILLNQELLQVTQQNKTIVDAAQNATSISQQTAAAVEEITASIDEQIKAIAQVAISAEQLTDLSQTLNQIVEKYAL
ncbi:methyl-accepting chemotaxis protein [Lysinibacillus piscis]|uniref:Methyl-accepting chemotaxis protein n=1 Tax=Lysinibacillus piscis TaxID=2518931 RepID=A0ABQ5NMS7_9BACI|nr:methyl-accepting chemotaxis protein [Lysinibacillus sp. KH24]GLC89612.1 methyl-accepting chemotaxis protein [Lysinibacillus sp. KH24]